MKKLRILSALFLIAALLVVPVSAASEFVPSVEEKKGLDFVDQGTGKDGYQIVCYIHDENGNNVAVLTRKTTFLTNLSEADEATSEVREGLLRVHKQLQTTPLTELFPNFAEEWAKATGGAPVANAVISHIFDISTDGWETDGKHSLYFDLTEHDVHPDTHIMLLHEYEPGKWEIIHCDHNEDGHITFEAKNGLSPFVLLIDNGGAPQVGPDAPKSPSTVEYTGMEFSVAAAVVLFSLSGICFVKSKRTAK